MRRGGGVILPSELVYKDQRFEAEAKKQDGLSLAAELDGEVVGYMIAYLISGGFGVEKSAWIGLFGVEPSIWEAALEKDWQRKFSMQLRKEA